MNSSVKSFVYFGIICAVFYYVYFFYYYSIHSVVPPGDSIDYHIPIAKSILNGTFLTGENFKMAQWYYPGASEIINSFFILFKFPLVFSNFLATGVLFFILIKLAKTFHISRDFSLLFALTIITLNIILRWLNQVTIDVWVVNFFLLLIIFLENPSFKKRYFLTLGFLAGMLIGSKYTAITLIIPLVIFYGKNILKKITIKDFVIFLIPFGIFGLFWYIRNFFLTGNPFFPLPVLGFPGKEIFGEMRVGNVTLEHPIKMLNAFFSEYKIWIFSIPFAIIFLMKRSWFKTNIKSLNNNDLSSLTRIFTIGIILFGLYFFYPTSKQEWIMVSSLRYSYPAFIMIILGVFKLAQIMQKESLIGFLSISSMLGIFLMEYHPKLLLLQLPMSLLLIWTTHIWIQNENSNERTSF